MNMNPPILITVYLLTCIASATTKLAIILLIACPLIWSRDPGRRGRASEAFRMLIWLFTGHRTK